MDVFEGITAWTYIGKFSGVSFGSILIGVVVGLLCCFMFRHLDFTPSPPYEFVLTFLFAYASYCLAEIMGLSGIMALFFCGICISHYNFYNMSRISQASMKHVVHSIALVAETFLYIYLGLTAAVSSKTQFNFKWSPIFIIVTLVCCFNYAFSFLT